MTLAAEHKFGIYVDTVKNNDAISAKDEARHGKALKGMLDRYFK